MVSFVYKTSFYWSYIISVVSTMAVCPMCIRIYSALLIVCTFGFNLRSTDATLADHFRVGEYPNCSILCVFISLNNYI